MMRYHLIALAVLLGVLGAGFGGELAAADHRLGRTQLRIAVFAVMGSVNPDLRITERLTGHCWTGSLADQGRADAWRCMAGNAILDPCFEAGFEPATVVCARSPMATEAVLLTLTEPLARTPGADPFDFTRPPWMIELANGATCLPASLGAGGAVAMMRVNYGCSDGSAGVGEINRDDPARWWIFVQQRDQWTLEQTDIAVAWY